MIKMQYKLLDFYKCTPDFFHTALLDCFADEKWLQPFLDDLHHGYQHSTDTKNEVIHASSRLTASELKLLIVEGEAINPEKPFESAIAAAEIGAVLHDNGRFNDEGLVLKDEQKEHNIVGANRAAYFCRKLGIVKIIPFVVDGIISHDFQSIQETSHYVPPKTMIGKLIQGADQIQWFHEDSIQRTMEYGKIGNRPFFISDISAEQRLNWQIGVFAKDSFTMMIKQLYGPTGEDRLGTEYFRMQAQKHKQELKKQILLFAKEQGFEKEAEENIEYCEKQELLR